MDPANDPLWYKDAVIYEVHVRAFFDSSGDGMGDFAGLTQKLDYLQDLGVTAIWILPFCPSPWRDDGYDISDYANVHPSYGTLRDFQNFLREAHRRGLRVITELVLNHTSDQHAWFQRSRRAAPNSRWRNYYVWSDTPERYRDARIIFKDFETSNWTWDAVAKAYYWHRFYSHQPDLNYDNPEVRAAMRNAVDFWLQLGVDGLRLDAVPYLYEREGTNCENLPETHTYLRELRAHMDERYRDRMLLAEANQWPEDAIAYFGAGDECHMAFHFPLMPRLFMATRMEERYPVTDILQLTPSIPETCQWALFLRNHDELTLEMVTDEERDYMYRVYAQDHHMRINLGIRRRLAPLLENDRRRIELMNGLLFSLPGTPVIYYGDEIGMGDNFYLGDRNGVRTPMQWSGDRNAGFSRANPQRLYLPVNIDPEYHYEAINVETQQNNPHSLLWWMKRALAQRKNSKALGRGSLELLYPDNRRILVFVRSYESENVLVVANLSRFAQSTEIDLSKYQGMVPVEMFGKSDFPAVTERPYFLSLGPHAFYWFTLQSKDTVQETLRIHSGEPVTLAVDSWEEVFSLPVRRALTRLLPAFLRGRRWYRAKHRPIRSTEICEIVPFPQAQADVLLIRVEYGDGDPEIYTLPLAVARGEAAARVTQETPQLVLARLEGPGGECGLLYGALVNSVFTSELLGGILRRRRFAGEAGELAAMHTRGFRALWGKDRPALDPTPAKADQDNTIIFFGERFTLKFFRKIEEGPHPEQEIGSLLTQVGFPNVAPLAGSIEYRGPSGDPMLVALLHGFVRGGTDAWRYTLDHLGLFYEHALARGPQGPTVQPPQPPPRDGAPAGESAQDLIGTYLEFVRLLGVRTGEMHAALASRAGDPVFSPELYTDFYRHGLYHGMLTNCSRTLDQLRSRMAHLPEPVRLDARAVLEHQKAIQEKLQMIRDQRFGATRIRIHGDYGLEQVLYTGKDFVILDFEGDPSRPLSERRIKRSPLQDVANMLVSFYQASHGALFGEATGVVPKPESLDALEAWAKFWNRTVSLAFLKSYFDTPGVAPLLPENPDQRRNLLIVFLLDRSLRKLSYELARSAERIRIPAHAILELLEAV